MKLESSAAPLTIATTMLHMRNVVSLSGTPLRPELLLFYINGFHQGRTRLMQRLGFQKFVRGQ